MELQKFFELVLLQIISNLVPIIVSGILGFTVTEIAKFLKKLDPKTLVILDGIVAMVVQAAEQSAIIGAIENTAKAKKAWAMERVKTFLKNMGLNYIDVDVIEAAIESAILKGIHKVNTEGTV